MTLTARGRPAFVVNVELFLHRDGRWLLIRRGMAEANAPGTLSGVGGKVELDQVGPNVLEQTAQREVAEEINVDIEGVELTYAESVSFVTDDGDPAVNVAFVAAMPADAIPVAASPEEVSEVVWLTLSEAEAHPDCRVWTVRALKAATAAVT